MRTAVRFDKHGLVVMVNDGEKVFAADPAGRIWMVYVSGVTWKRSRLDTWYRVARDPWPALEPLDREEVRSQLPGWKQYWKEAAAAITRAGEPALEQAAVILKAWCSGFEEFHARDAGNFESVYGRIPILPPDAYQALYVRITRGCPWNRCSFCNFYAGQGFHVPEQAELLEHLRRVRDYWGAAIGSRNRLFLGDANALAIPAPILRSRLEHIRRAFPEPQFTKIHSFLDYFTGRRRPAKDFHALREAGIERISIGIESGSEPILQAISKPMEIAGVETMIRQISSSGIRLNLIFILGLGGEELRELHLEKSVALISRLPLSPSDRIFLSPLAETDSYREVALQNGWISLPASEMQQEFARWRDSIQARHPHLQVSLYNIRLFDY